MHVVPATRSLEAAKQFYSSLSSFLTARDVSLESSNSVIWPQNLTLLT